MIETSGWKASHIADSVMENPPVCTGLTYDVFFHLSLFISYISIYLLATASQKYILWASR